MSDLILGRLFDASVQGIVAVAIVAVLVRVFRQIGPNGRCWLWRLCWIKMLISLAWIAEVPLLQPSADIPGGETSLQMVPTSLMPGGGAAPTSLAIQPPVLTLGQILAYIWLAGMLAAVILTIGSTIYARYFLKPAQEAGGALACEVALSMGLRVPLVRLHETLRTPCVAGVFRPVIYLPVGLSELEQRGALAHEMAHIRRRDAVWQWLQTGLICIFWFLPIWPLLARATRAEAEMACDSLAVKTSQTSPAEYARLLVRLASSSRPAFAIQMAARTRRSLEQRLIEMQNKYPKKLSWRLVAALLPLVVIAAVPSRAVPQPAVVKNKSTTHSTRKNLGTSMVGWPDVPEELGLSAAQKKALQQSWDTEMVEIRQLGDKLAEFARRKASNKERFEYDTKTRIPIFLRNQERIWNLLTPAQQERVGQLASQYYGPQTAYWKENAEMLGLSKDQRDRLKNLNDEYFKFLNDQSQSGFYGFIRPVKIRDLTAAEKKKLADIEKELYTATGDRRDELIRRQALIKSRVQKYPVVYNDPAGNRAENWIEKIMVTRRAKFAEISTKALAVLTPAQKAKWDTYLGKPFTFKIPGEGTISYR